MRRLATLAVAIALALSFSGIVRAQTTSAAITGRVTDPQKALVVGAVIAAINAGTSVRYGGSTNSTGEYYVANLPPGTYRIEVEKTGFKTVIKPDVVLHLQDTLEINFEMTLGSMSESVTVEAGALNINTTDGSVGTTVDHNFVENMPLNGRSFQDLILLTPGTLTQNPQVSNQSTTASLGSSGEFSVNGQRPESNYYTVDGVSANLGTNAGVGFVLGAGPSGSVPLGTALGTTQALVSVDDLQEFRVQSSTYSAEFGRSPGGQFAFETKAGANQWHGSAYDYLRNGALDAPDWFDDYLDVKESALRQNDFGGTLGGPVSIPDLYDGKNKTFFFLSYEGLRLTQPQAATVNFVPDVTLRANAPAPLNQVLNAFAVPNGPDVGNGIAEFIGSWSNPSSLDSTSIRLDHVITDKLRLFFRFSDTSSSSASRGIPPDQTPTEYQTLTYLSRTFTGGVTSQLSSSLSNEFHLNYSSNAVKSPQTVTTLANSTPVDLANLTGLGSGASVFVDLLYGGYFVSLQQFQQSAIQRQLNLVDTFAMALGRHQVKLGVDYRRLAPSSVPFDPNAGYYYLSEAAVESNSAVGIMSSQSKAYPLYKNFSAFVQDEWRISQRLNVSLGLRWEVNPAPGVTQGLKPYTIEGAGPSTWNLAPEGTPLWRTTWYNFAPRIGAAYVLGNAPERETVIRGGAGIYYDTGQQLGSQGFLGPGFSALNFFFAPFAFPLPPAEASPPIVNPPVAPYNSDVYAFPAHLQLPYTVQWNASVEQALGASQSLSISYVGAHAARLLANNEISTTNVNVPDGFVIVENGLTSDYNALQLQFRRRLTHGLTALASYTWSHCIDYGSQNYFFAYQRGNCDFDVRQNFSGALSYNLPNVGQDRFFRAVLDNWGLDDRVTVRTGFPVTLEGSSVIDPATGQVFHSGLDLVSDQSVYIYGAQCAEVYDNGLACPGGRAINPDAFSLPPAGEFGDAPRNFARGFGAFQMDLAIRREFPIREGLKLQFRAESFNILNHPNFGSINSNFGQATFGQATGTLANSLGILSPLYQMGGPRSMQFALKFIF